MAFLSRSRPEALKGDARLGGVLILGQLFPGVIILTISRNDQNQKMGRDFDHGKIMRPVVSSKVHPGNSMLHVEMDMRPTSGPNKSRCRFRFPSVPFNQSQQGARCTNSKSAYPLHAPWRAAARLPGMRGLAECGCEVRLIFPSIADVLCLDPNKKSTSCLVRRLVTVLLL